ncbi:hypothetical protein [Burkholderia sp. Ac-20353]|uniref:hypothetical protein n=1 Tax=Burkholderia sp. Ac-20353 TaxID=2703894 RepID=UPI00197C8011|nr:hypothetical protein [Burkholderia sp. Ac-20353]MBN3789621.1 hypothetical protein [Burkholderia sp. Ac-20353]
MRKLLKLCALGLVLFSISSQVSAQDGNKVIRVANGINRLQLHGYDAMIVRAWRENFNAHGFDVVSIFVRDGMGNRGQSWSVVPIFRPHNGDDHEELHVMAGGGADCQLHDFRLLVNANGEPAQLILANRDAGTSYASAANVRFDYYVLAENTDGSPGHPPLYFEWKKSASARKQYCDVNRAFDRELHLGTSSGSDTDSGIR